MRRDLIINADDFGLDDDTVAETASLFAAGCVTSASILTDGRAAEAAFDHARTWSKEVSFGLHFNIAEVLDHRPVDSSLANAGDFHGPYSLRARALVGLLRGSDLRRELRRQLVVLQKAGIRATHLDSHGHIHKYGSLLKEILPVMQEFGVRRVRRPQNHFIDRRSKRTLSSWRIPEGLDATDTFFNPHNREPDWLRRYLQTLPPGLHELGVHPGVNEEFRRLETQPLKTELKDETNRLGITLANYR